MRLSRASRAASTSGSWSRVARASPRGASGSVVNPDVHEVAALDQLGRGPARPGESVGLDRRAVRSEANSDAVAADAGHDRRHDIAGFDGVDPVRMLEVPGAGAGVGAREHVAPRAAETVPLVERAQAVLDGAVRGALQVDVEGGADHQAVLIEPPGTVLALQVLADFLEEVGRDGVAALPARGEHDRLRHLVGGCLLRDVLFFRHPAQRVVAPFRGRLHVHEGAEARRSLDDAGDYRRLAQLDVAGGLAEQELRRGLDPVRGVRGRAEPDLVGVEGENLGLRVALLEMDRVVGLEQLPLPHLLAAQDLAAHLDVARELHGQGACAAEQLAPQHVLDRGADDARHADAVVPEEGVVLGGDDRLPEDVRDVVVADDDAPLDGELADQLTPPGLHARDGVGRVVVEGDDLRKVRRVGEQDAAYDPEDGGDREQPDESSRSVRASGRSRHALPGL